jgi:hypothetical protein
MSDTIVTPESARAARSNRAAAKVDAVINGSAVEHVNGKAGQQEQAVGIVVIDEANKIAAAAEGGDPGAPFEDAAIVILRRLHSESPAAWQRLRKRLKDAKVGIRELEKLMRGDDGGAEDDETLADRLVSMAKSQCDLVHDQDGEPFALFDNGGARNVLHLDSRAYGEWLSHSYYRSFDRAPSEAALRTALATLKGAAKFDGEEKSIHVRVAARDGAYWLDLCDESWRCVRIDSRGWQICTAGESPLFTRSSSMRALPVPERNGDITALWGVINIPEKIRPFVLVWLMECLRPDTPYAVLELVGEQGSAKSGAQSFLRSLIDPNQANLRAAPKAVDDVWIAARNAHMVSLENISHLSAAYQDALCVLATGGGQATRTLYTNTDETVLLLKKPIVINGISVIVTAQDLLDRSIHVDLPEIKERMTVSEVDSRFLAAHGKIVGALLDLFVRVLAELPKVIIPPSGLPRMADFAKLGEALLRISGGKSGDFLREYGEMRADGVSRTIDASPVGAAIVAFMEANNGFDGTVQQLLGRLERHKPSGESWPRSAKGLADAIRRLAPGLRQIRINARLGERTKDGYRVTLGVTTDKNSRNQVHQVHQVHQESQDSAGKVNLVNLVNVSEIPFARTDTHDPGNDQAGEPGMRF